MESFPCPREQLAASALLLLSTTTSPAVFHSMFDLAGDFDFDEEESIGEESKIESCRGSSVLIDSSSITPSENSDLSTDEISPPSTRIVTFVRHRSEMKLKVVRKTRSKIHKSFGGWKLSSGENAVTSSGSVSTESSCLTIGCSASSSARSCGYVTRTKEVRQEQKRIQIGSKHIRRRAQGILNLLSGRWYSEVTIRRLLGDTPDTSKALRILLKLEEVKRTGSGGRQDPYIYTDAGVRIAAGFHSHCPQTGRMYYHPPTHEDHHHQNYSSRKGSGNSSSSYGAKGDMGFDTTEFIVYSVA